MRKIEAAFTSLLLTALISSVIMVSVRGGSIEAMTRWTNYTYRGPDTFYGEGVETIVAYEAGSAASLIVSVKNDVGARINVSVVGMSFDWQKPEGGWYNSTQVSKQNPVVLEPDETMYFKVNFTTPSVDVAQKVPHDYMVYIEYVDAAGSSGGWNATRTILFGDKQEYFVVYSADQAKSKHYDQIINEIKEPTWNSTEAKMFWQRAMNESSVADYYYGLGDFSQAVVHYGSALNLIDRAFTAEEIKGASSENADINLKEAKVKESEAWANFANGLSNMWTLIGIALVLFALGYIIRGLAMLRRTSIPA